MFENTWGDNVLRQSKHRQENEQEFGVYVNRLHPQKGLTRQTANSTILIVQNWANASNKAKAGSNGIDLK